MALMIQAGSPAQRFQAGTGNARSVSGCLSILAGLMVWLLACVNGGAAFGQGPKLQFNLRNVQMARTSGPTPLDVDLFWNGTSILEGTLTLRLHDGPIELGQAHYTPLVLSPGTNTRSILLPAMRNRSTNQSVELDAVFTTASEERIVFPDLTVRVPVPGQRVLRISICHDGFRLNERQTAAVKSLRLEEYWKPANSNSTNPRLLTLTDLVSTDGMPVEPAYLCSSNIVVITSSALVQLKSDQLKSLTDWVRAGACLCVEATGALAPHHAEFLAALAPGRTDLQPGSSGRIEAEGGGDFILLSPGLGSAVVFLKPIEEQDLSSPDWMKVVGHVWRLRGDQRTAMIESQKLEHLPVERLVPRLEEHGGNVGYDYNYGYQYQPGYDMQQQLSDDLSVIPLSTGHTLLDVMMPSEVEVVPLPYIALILVLYVIAIGPLDYKVLGWLKLRRFTWITFPAMTVAFTLFTIWLSHSFLDSSTERSQLVISDVDADGSVLRTNRVELLFTMSSHEVETPLKGELFTALDHAVFSGSQYDMYRRGSTSSVEPATIVGRPPSSYSAIQQMPQWTPQLNRILSIAPEGFIDEERSAAATLFNWHISEDITTVAGRSELTQRIQQTFGSDCSAVLLNQGQLHSLSQSFFSVFSSTGYSYPMSSGSDERHATSFLYDLCVRLQGRGFFGLVSSVAPHGGDNFEDLAILDPSSPDDWLLVVVDPRPEDIRVYRHAFRVKTDQTGF